jgi:hypothetical protein
MGWVRVAQVPLDDGGLGRKGGAGPGRDAAAAKHGRRQGAREDGALKAEAGTFNDLGRRNSASNPVRREVFEITHPGRLVVVCQDHARCTPASS